MEREDEDSRMSNTSIFGSPDTSARPPELPLGSDGRIDVDATLLAFRRLLGHIAAATNETPRSVLEDEFKHAPPDEFWRATIGRKR